MHPVSLPARRAPRHGRGKTRFAKSQAARSARTNRMAIEDACAFAWKQFLERQPPRDEDRRGWLFRTAQRQAWVLEAGQREHRSLGEDAYQQDRTFAEARLPRRDPYATRLDVDDAFDVLDRLPERLRRIALLRALGMRHKDIGELTGDSPVRVGQLSRANMHIYEILEERARDQRDCRLGHGGEPTLSSAHRDGW